MANITDLSLSQIKKELDGNKLSGKEVVLAFKQAYEADQAHKTPLNGYIEFFDDAEKLAEASDARRKNNEARGLEGLPLAIKDNILIQGKIATCGSSILKDFRAPYSSTVVERLKNQGIIPVGRTNMDEFGMGSSCEYSIYGPTRNPMDRNKTPGGSSGGSASVVAGKQAPAALGTETGGSVRLPAAFCGIYGLKPSYGTLSRYGVVAYGSSLDQIGILSRDPDDMALLLEHGVGTDPHDETSAALDFSGVYPLKPKNPKGLKIALPEEFMGEGIDEVIKNKVTAFASWFEKQGATVESIKLPILKSTVAIYYIIAPAEASSNLTRYDGIRYGFRDEKASSLEDLYIKSRSQGFGDEVKRRIFIGNYVLSSGYYDAYYKKAMQVRSILKQEIAKVYENYDLILSPTSPCLPFNLGAKLDDPLAMYLTDICTTFVNLAQIPSLSVPCGTSEEGLPIGIQLIGKQFSEINLLSIAKTWHQEEGLKQ
ncbi:MAG: Asp-tRNA(Asn)/Glu-tRNA(Gln) amidotransferase subunit GatA [Spirochaetales bacterium]|nr:Asp-tRNA(Asn)/Glu-tRNA(Gln) amidotransferase subunit GatA [Spirochaetales bacterium]